MDLAEEFGALVVRPEHRYLGLSTSHGLNYLAVPACDPEMLKKMTPDNTKMDIGHNDNACIAQERLRI
jgi:hypothetical protein